MNATELADRYYLDLAAAFVRGRIGAADGLNDVETFRLGQQAGLRLHKFKRGMALPRVLRVLGLLRALGPTRLLDVGSGRGAFLWPLLDAFPALPVLAADRDGRRAADLAAVARGGVGRLAAAQLQAECLALRDGCVDAVTMLEVIEHLPRPEKALAEALRVSRRIVIVSVPSRPDNNPGHLHLFDRRSLETLLSAAGARRVALDYVHNHVIALARVR